jgi:hypothetical protein
LVFELSGFKQRTRQKKIKNCENSFCIPQATKKLY